MSNIFLMVISLVNIIKQISSRLVNSLEYFSRTFIFKTLDEDSREDEMCIE